MYVFRVARISLRRATPEVRTVSAVLENIPVSGRTAGESAKHGYVVGVAGAHVIFRGFSTTQVQLIVCW